MIFFYFNFLFFLTHKWRYDLVYTWWKIVHVRSRCLFQIKIGYARRRVASGPTIVRAQARSEIEKYFKAQTKPEKLRSLN